MKYLLYIDILGFSDLVKSGVERVRDLYRVIAGLNAHAHTAFKVIVFSDTVLIYNTVEATSLHDHRYFVMYLCEMAQDLQDRLVGRDISFRAILTYGEFVHYTIRSVPCFFGSALIDAYRDEKSIKSVGLFIDNKINRHNEIFETAPHDNKYSFVFLTQGIQQLEQLYGGRIPLPDVVFDDTDFGWVVGPEVLMIARIHHEAQASTNDISQKYKTAWMYYIAQYPKKKLAAHDFDLNTVCEDYDWTEIESRYPEDHSYVENDEDKQTSPWDTEVE